MFNVVRTYPEPASLAAQSSYSKEDVWNTLKEIFFDKCYLCESNECSDVNVEHLRPHLQDKSLMYSWNNLYYSCSRCNNIKSDNFTNILDCADPSIDVFKKIKILPPRSRAASITIIPNDQQPDTLETVELLSQIYNNNSTINKKISGAHLRKSIYRKYNSMADELTVYYDEKSTDAQKSAALDKLAVLMQKRQPFSAFLRWMILEDDELKPLLEIYMD